MHEVVCLWSMMIVFPFSISEVHYFCLSLFENRPVLFFESIAPCFFFFNLFSACCKRVIKSYQDENGFFVSLELLLTF